MIYPNNLKIRSTAILLFLFSILCAEDVSPLPNQVGKEWVKETTQSPEKLEGLVQHLKAMKERFPEENREEQRQAIDAIEKNLRQLRALKETKGGKILQYPEKKPIYTLDEIDELIKSIYRSNAQKSELQLRQKQLEKLYAQTAEQIDVRREKFERLEPGSLQRMLAGLSLMSAQSNFALINEQRRLSKEEISGIDAYVNWKEQVLKEALEKIDFHALDSEKLQKTIEETRGVEGGQSSQLLEGGAPLILTGERLRSGHYLDLIDKMLGFASLQNTRLRLSGMYAIALLNEKNGSNLDTEQILEKIKKNFAEISSIDNQLVEWKELIRQEQNLLLISAPSQEENLNNYLSLQISMKKLLEGIERLKEDLLVTKAFNQIAFDQAVQQVHWLSGLVDKASYIFFGFFEEIFGWFSYSLFRLNERNVTIYAFFRAIFIVLLTFWLSSKLPIIFSKLARNREHISAASLYTFNRVVHYAVIILGILVALGSVGIDFSSFLIIAGALSVGVGFGLQGIVNNFLSGLIILFDRKLRVGDLVELQGGELGNITEVNIQNTVIRTLRGLDVLVPNSEILNKQLTNWTLRDQFARFHIAFSVAYGTDKEFLKKVLVDAAKTIDETVFDHRRFPDPDLWLVEFGNSSLNFELVVWVDFKRGKIRRGSLYADLRWLIETTLRENHIEIPFPQRDLHIKSINGELPLPKKKKTKV